jgi:hypothetical protein
MPSKSADCNGVMGHGLYGLLDSDVPLPTSEPDSIKTSSHSDSHLLDLLGDIGAAPASGGPLNPGPPLMNTNGISSLNNLTAQSPIIPISGGPSLR